MAYFYDVMTKSVKNVPNLYENFIDTAKYVFSYEIIFIIAALSPSSPRRKARS